MPRENESVKKSVRLILLLKARVHGHLRHLSSGAAVWVSEHEDRRERRAERDPSQGMLFGAELPGQNSLPFQTPAGVAVKDEAEPQNSGPDHRERMRAKMAEGGLGTVNRLLAEKNAPEADPYSRPASDRMPALMARSGELLERIGAGKLTPDDAARLRAKVIAARETGSESRLKDSLALIQMEVAALESQAAESAPPAPEPPAAQAAAASAIPAGIGSAEFHHAMDKLISEHGASGTSILLDRAERDPDTTVFRPPMIAALRAELERRHPGTRADVDGLRAAMIEHERKKQALAAPAQAEEPPHDPFEDEIPMSAAVAAHAGTSHSPESRGAYMRREYAATLRRDFDMLSKYAKTPEKKAALEEEFDRYHAGYRRKYMAYLHARASLISPMIAGPSKFPTRRAEKASNSSDKRGQEADDFRESALAAIKKKLTPELQPIMSSDANAGDRLQAKIAQAEKLQERMAAINAAHKRFLKNPASLEASGLSDSDKAIIRNYKPTYSWEPHPFAPYQLQNNNANIRRMKQRVEQVGETQAAPVSHAEGTAARIEDDPPANRVRLIFPGKPDEATRSKLKAAGFRWAPSTGAWQAYRNYRSMTVANEVAGVKKSLPALLLLKSGPAPAHDPEKAQHVQSTRGGDGRELHWYRSPEGHYYSSDVPPAARRKDEQPAPGGPGKKPADTTDRSKAEQAAQGGEDRQEPDVTEHEIEDTKTGLIFRVRLAPREKKALGVEK